MTTASFAIRATGGVLPTAGIVHAHSEVCAGRLNINFSSPTSGRQTHILPARSQKCNADLITTPTAIRLLSKRLASSRKHLVHASMAETDAGFMEDVKGRDLQKVRVVLGPYKGKSIAVTSVKYTVSPEEVEKALKEKMEKAYVLERINFTGSGAKIGHTVRVSFEGKYVDGPMAGQLIKGTKADMFELELQPREDEPWKTIVAEIVAAGMGQEESKTFELRFPDNYKAKPLAGLKARFTVTIKEIGVKRMLEKDVRPIEEQRAELAAQLQAAAEKRTNTGVDLLIRNEIIRTSEADVEKVAASVSWAKFGEKSLNDFRWNVLQEEISRVEGIPFEKVPAFLRNEANITYKKP